MSKVSLNDMHAELAGSLEENKSELYIQICFKNNKLGYMEA